MTSDEVLARVTPSGPRRAFALGCLYGLAGLLIVLAISAPVTSVVGTGGLFLAGASSGAAGYALQRASARTLVLTREALAEEDGVVLVSFDQIAAVERGLLAFKPSNGFLIRLTDPARAHWAPGLWWRFGRQLGVGGVTAAGEAKAMADLIAVMLKERETLS